MTLDPALVGSTRAILQKMKGMGVNMSLSQVVDMYLVQFVMGVGPMMDRFEEEKDPEKQLEIVQDLFGVSIAAAAVQLGQLARATAPNEGRS